MFNGSMIPGNNQIWVFVWKYAESIQELLVRVLESGATISGSKMVLAMPRLQLLGAEVAIDRAHVLHEVTVILALPIPFSIQKWLLHFPIPSQITPGCFLHTSIQKPISG